MYIKASTGTSFSAAAQYNEEGLSAQQRQQKSGKVQFLDGYNLISEDARGIAAEMSPVASRSRTQQPVWNVSFSVEPGKRLTDQEWKQAVGIYLDLMGAPASRHQVAIWRHSDTGNDHVHALINAVPIDGGPALLRYHNNKKAVVIADAIDQTLGQPIEKHINVREIIGQAIQRTLQDGTPKPTTFDELAADLNQVGIRAIITTQANGRGGASFRMGNHEPVKGSALGYKFAELARQLEANRAEYLAEIERLKKELEQKPAVVEIIRPDAGQQAEIQQLRHERDEAYEKRDRMREAYLNKPATTVLKEVEVIREIVKPDPADQVQINQLSHQLRITQNAYMQQQQKVNEVATTVAEVLSENQDLIEQNRQQQRLHQEQLQARVDKYNDLVRRFNESQQRLRDLKAAPSPVVQPVSASGPVASPAPSVVATPPGGAAPLGTTPTSTPALSKTATPAPEQPIPGPTVSSEPDWYELFRKLTRQKKSYLGAWDLQKHISDSRAINALKLTLHQEKGELCLTDQHNRTATFTQLGLDWKKLGITGLDKNNIPDLKKARAKGQGQSL